MTLFYHAVIESLLLFTLAAWLGLALFEKQKLTLPDSKVVQQADWWARAKRGDPVQQLQHIYGPILKDSSHQSRNIWCKYFFVPLNKSEKKKLFH